jgi:hypothetical protein
MKKIRLTESDLKKLVYETAMKTLGLIKESGEERPLPGHWEHVPTHFARLKNGMYGRKEWPTWYDRDFQEPDGNYGEETDASIKAEIEDVYNTLQSYRVKALNIVRWGQKNNVAPQYVERAFQKNAPYGLGLTYIRERAKRDGVQMLEVALNAPKEPKEQVIEDMTSILRPQLEDTYKKWYNKYEDDYQAAMEHRGKFDQAMNPLIEKYANADPSTMTYADICEALDSLKNAYLTNPDERYWAARRYEGIETYGVDKYYEGNPILETYKKLQQEKSKRRSSVRFYNIGYLNKFEPQYHPSQAEIDEWEELKALLKKYKEINGGSSDNHRGDNAAWGDIIDQNGELVAIYNYKVDSSG